MMLQFSDLEETMFRHNLKLTRALLVAGLVCLGGTAAFAQAPAERLTALPSGKRIPILFLGQAMGGDGNKTIAVLRRYRTDKPLVDRDHLAWEADDIWDLFKMDADRSGLSTAVIVAEGPPGSAGNGKAAAVNFVLVKEPSGSWTCKTDKIVGVGSPAKAAYRQGFEYFSKGNYAEAVNSYSRSIALDANYAQSYVDRAGIYVMLNQMEKALFDCEKGIMLMPNNSAAYCNRGLIYASQGKHKEAVEDFSTSIRLNPGFGLSYAGRGSELVKMGQFHQALDDLNKAIQMNARSGESLYHRAAAFEHLAKLDRQNSLKLGYHPTPSKSIAQRPDTKGKI